MKFEKSLFKPKQKLTAAAMNRIENALATITETLYQTNDIMISELLGGLFDEADCIITSEDMVAQLAEGTPYDLIVAGFQLGIKKDQESLQSDSFDAITGCKYDDVKYYCKPVVSVADESVSIFMGNLKALHDLLARQGDSEGAELLQKLVSDAGYTLDMFENLPFICIFDNVGVALLNIENDNITEHFGSHTFEIISSIPIEHKGIIQESMIIDKLPNQSEEVFIQGFNVKTCMELVVKSRRIPVIINGSTFNMRFTDCFIGQLPDGSSPSNVYYATVLDMDIMSNRLFATTHYFTDLADRSAFDADGRLIYRGSRSANYTLS